MSERRTLLVDYECLSGDEPLDIDGRRDVLTVMAIFDAVNLAQGRPGYARFGGVEVSPVQRGSLGGYFRTGRLSLEAVATADLQAISKSLSKLAWNLMNEGIFLRTRAVWA